MRGKEYAIPSKSLAPTRPTDQTSFGDQSPNVSGVGGSVEIDYSSAETLCPCIFTCCVFSVQCPRPRRCRLRIIIHRREFFDQRGGSPHFNSRRGNLFAAEHRAESSGLISASTTYALPAWTGASLQSSESAPDISTLTVGIYSQPNIAESSGLISASTTYALPAWTGASLQSRNRLPTHLQLSTLGNCYSQPNIAESSVLISASQVSFGANSPNISNVGGNVTLIYSGCDNASRLLPPDTSTLVMASYSQPNISDFGFRSGTGFVSLSKNISDLTANGNVIVGWTLIYQTTGTI